MAIKQYFLVNNIHQDKYVEFKYYNGFSLTQKQKSIKSMHEQIKLKEEGLILEISSKSDNELGVLLSAFNLTTKYKNKDITVEKLFQSSKVFENGGPYTDILNKSSLEAKKDERLRNSGNLIGFVLDGKQYPIYPKTLFYDWIYCNAILENEVIMKEIIKYDIFTDIAFNHQKSINCQARSAAIFVYLYKNNLLKEALSDIEKFEKLVY